MRIVFETVEVTSWLIVSTAAVLLWAIFRVPLGTRLLLTCIGLALFIMWAVEMLQHNAIKKLRSSFVR